MLDYFQVGQRIRKYRKAQRISQEQLAERTGISITHMSHIETGNTKLSLPVFAAIAEALGVQTDDLLSDEPSGRSAAVQELNALFDSCSTKQLRILADILAYAKNALDKYDT